LLLSSEVQPQIPFGFAQGRLSTHHPQAEVRLGPRSEFVTFLNLRDFSAHKSFGFSIDFLEKSKKSQALRMTASLGN